MDVWLGMGVSEHLVDDGNGNELNISCPDDEEQGYVSAYAALADKQYSSSDELGFDVIVNGKTYSNPFYTGCRACGDIFRGEFWEALRKANRLQLSARSPVMSRKKLPIGIRPSCSICSLDVTPGCPSWGSWKPMPSCCRPSRWTTSPPRR